MDDAKPVPGILSATTGHIRRAAADDLGTLLALEQLFPGDRITRRNLRHLIHKAHADVWVLEDRAAIVASAVVLYRKGFDSARLYSLVVRPEQRGRGLARQLLGHAEKAAQQQGCRSMRLEVREDNTPAINLYTSLGYELIGRTANYYEDDSHALRMRKKLIAFQAAVSLKVPFYPQSLDFTCGAASLMMAMRALGFTPPLSRELELQLWREATTIFMMSGHGGCSAEGLAAAALRRGFHTIVYSRDSTVPFLDSVRNVDKKEVLSLSHEQFCRELEERHGEQRIKNFTIADIEQHLQQGQIPLLLVSGYRLYGEKIPHWLLITGFDEEHFYVHDPYIPEGLDKADGVYLQLSKTEFERISRFGKAKHRYMLVIAPKAPPLDT